MKVSSIRFGHANNSSSSHSVVILPEAVGWSNTDTEFGWEFFTAGTVQAKLTYLAHMIENAIALPKDHARPVVLDLLRRAGAKESDVSAIRMSTDEGYYGGAIEGYIDHQSMINLPPGDKEGTVHLGFLQHAMRYFVYNDRAAVLGGNDNTDETHSLLSKATSFLFEGLETDTGRGHGKTRQDGDWFTIFNRKTGNKIRVAMNPDAKEYTRATWPELVDLKITDFCDIGCKYCYQDSTAKGKHAAKDYLHRVICYLSDAGVFEIAIGGGEPTKYPDFSSILSSINFYRMNANFTTKSTEWMKDHKQAKEILDSATSFAYSINSAYEAKSVLEVYKKIPGEHLKQISFQYVMGTASSDELTRVMSFCAVNDIRLTLLGYKTTGRGEAWKGEIEDNTGWLKMANALSCHLAIDTVLAAQSAADLADVPKWLYEVEDGNFSMYIDGVKQTCATSSYVEAAGFIPFTLPDQMGREKKGEGARFVSSIFAKLPR